MDIDTEAVRENRGPIYLDESGFAKWLLLQVERRGPIGALARVAAMDPFWPGYQNRAQIIKHFRDFKAQQHVIGALTDALSEYEKTDAARKKQAKAVMQRKAARAAQKTSRKRNRRR